MWPPRVTQRCKYRSAKMRRNILKTTEVRTCNVKQPPATVAVNASHLESWKQMYRTLRPRLFRLVRREPTLGASVSDGVFVKTEYNRQVSPKTCRTPKACSWSSQAFYSINRCPSAIGTYQFLAAGYHPFIRFFLYNVHFLHFSLWWFSWTDQDRHSYNLSCWICCRKVTRSQKLVIGVDLRVWVELD